MWGNILSMGIAAAVKKICCGDGILRLPYYDNETRMCFVCACDQHCTSTSQQLQTHESRAVLEYDDTLVYPSW